MSAIGIDIDDVLFPWYATAHLICERAGLTKGAEATSWAPYENYGCTRDQWIDALTAATLDGSLYTGPPMGDSVEQLHRLVDAGHDVHLVTARGFFMNGHLIRTMTINWLGEWGVPHTSLTFSKDKTVVRTDWFLDDAAHNYDQLLGHTEVRLLDAPHNLSDPECKRLRVPSVQAFVDLVLGADQ